MLCFVRPTPLPCRAGSPAYRRASPGSGAPGKNKLHLPLDSAAASTGIIAARRDLYGIFHSGAVAPVRGDHPRPALVRPDRPAEAQPGGGEIGLLKPSRVAESGYRYYGPAEVDRLQDILYYRALGVELARIRECLDDPAFDRLAALQSHLTALEAERTRLDALIRSVRDTIRCEERKEIMSDEQKFEALKQQVLTRYEQVYGKEAREKYGDHMVDAAQSAIRDLTAEQYRSGQVDEGLLDRARQWAVKEAQEDGYPAPHMIVFLDCPVTIKLHKGRYGQSWRIVDPRILRRIGKDPALRRLSRKNHVDAIRLNPIWKYGFIDIQGIVKGDRFRNRRDAVSYAYKYLTKSLVDDHGRELESLDSISSCCTKSLRISLWGHLANKSFGLRDITYGKKVKEFLEMLPEESEEEDPQPTRWEFKRAMPRFVYEDMVIKKAKKMLRKFKIIEDPPPETPPTTS